MIRTFRDKGLRRFFEANDPRKLSVQKPDRVARILSALDAAERPEDMNIPGYRFHALAGKLKGRFSVTVSGNWRITFGWDGQDAIELDLEDYH